MANAADGDLKRFRRRFRIAVFAAAAVLIVLPFLALWLVTATDIGRHVASPHSDRGAAETGGEP